MSCMAKNMDICVLDALLWRGSRCINAASIVHEESLEEVVGPQDRISRVERRL